MNYFVNGFVSVANLVLAVAGGTLALIVAVICVAALILLASWLFDVATSKASARWSKSGKKPKYRWQRILMHGDTDEPV